MSDRPANDRAKVPMSDIDENDRTWWVENPIKNQYRVSGPLIRFSGASASGDVRRPAYRAGAHGTHIYIEPLGVDINAGDTFAIDFTGQDQETVREFDSKTRRLVQNVRIDQSGPFSREESVRYDAHTRRKTGSYFESAERGTSESYFDCNGNLVRRINTSESRDSVELDFDHGRVYRVQRKPDGTPTSTEIVQPNGTSLTTVNDGYGTRSYTDIKYPNGRVAHVIFDPNTGRPNRVTVRANNRTRHFNIDEQSGKASPDQVSDWLSSALNLP